MLHRCWSPNGSPPATFRNKVRVHHTAVCRVPGFSGVTCESSRACITTLHVVNINMRDAKRKLFPRAKHTSIAHQHRSHFNKDHALMFPERRNFLSDIKMALIVSHLAAIKRISVTFRDADRRINTQDLLSQNATYKINRFIFSLRFNENA
ncbi:hypothetical protein J6590_085770 [Homalodisca vitripennis]|nr:hypothetical protein J6590_085770 [Homalodisca vitripennis]